MLSWEWRGLRACPSAAEPSTCYCKGDAGHGSFISELHMDTETEGGCVLILGGPAPRGTSELGRAVAPRSGPQAGPEPLTNEVYIL